MPKHTSATAICLDRRDSLSLCQKAFDGERSINDTLRSQIAAQDSGFHIVEVDASYEAGDFNSLIVVRKGDSENVSITLPPNPPPRRRIEVKLEGNVHAIVLGNGKKIDDYTQIDMKSPWSAKTFTYIGAGWVIE
jgi:hypothetical protein